MDNNAGPDSKQKTSFCEKFLSSVRSTTPFRVGRSSLQQQCGDAAAARKTSPHVSLVSHPPIRDRCGRISKQLVAPADHSLKVPKWAVPIIIDAAPMMPSKAQEKATVVRIHGQENGVPSMEEYGQGVPHDQGNFNVMFSDFIVRAGRKIRTTTNVGVRKLTMRRDSFNDRVSDFIDGAKNRFHTAPSFVEAGKTASLKQEPGIEKRNSSI